MLCVLAKGKEIACRLSVEGIRVVLAWESEGAATESAALSPANAGYAPRRVTEEELHKIAQDMNSDFRPPFDYALIFLAQGGTKFLPSGSDGKADR